MKFVMFEGRLVPWPEVAAQRRERARSSLPCPSIIRDALDGVKNPVDGKLYDSKSEYYRAVKEAGCEIVGNEAEKFIDKVAPWEGRTLVNSANDARPNVGHEEIGAALHKVKEGYQPKQWEANPRAVREAMEISAAFATEKGEYVNQQYPEGKGRYD